MSRIGLPVCPHCKKRVNPIRAWYLKREGEYLCPKCGNISNVVLHPVTPFLGAGAVVVGLLIFLLSKAFSETPSLMSILFILIPFALFFILSTFMIELKEPVYRKKAPPEPPNPRRAEPPERPAGTRPQPPTQRPQRPQRPASPYAQPPTQRPQNGKNGIGHTRQF